MTLKDLALALNTFKKIVIVEDIKEGGLQDTKVFDNSDQLFNDSINNVLWKPEFYNREVKWLTDDGTNRNGESVFKIRIK